MEIEVHLPTLLRDSTYRQSPLAVQGVTLAEALHNLVERYPLLRVHLYDEDGRLRPHVLMYFNSDNLAWLDSFEIPLRPGDSLQVLQAVSGG